MALKNVFIYISKEICDYAMEPDSESKILNFVIKEIIATEVEMANSMVCGI